MITHQKSRLAIVFSLVILLSMIPFAASAQAPETYRIFTGTEVPPDLRPGNPDTGEPINYGMKFNIVAPGQVNGLYLYLQAGDVEAHQIALWNYTTEEFIDDANYAGTGEAGWVYAPFNSPVHLEPGYYVASYFDRWGYYTAACGSGANPEYSFIYTWNAGPIYVQQNAGRWSKDASLAFPRTQDMDGCNYMIDLEFQPDEIAEPTPTAAPTITPTPSYLEAVTLPSTGNTLVIEKRVTYGEIAIVITGMVLIAVLLIIAFLVVPRLWQ